MGKWLVMVLGLSLVASEGVRAQNASIADILASQEVVEEGGRKLVVATLADVLRMAKDRNQFLDSLRMGIPLAESRLLAAENRLNPTVTTSVAYDHSFSRSSGTSAAAAGNFVNLAGSDLYTFSSSYNQKLYSGIQVGMTYAETRSRFQSGAIATQGAAATLGPMGTWLDANTLKGTVTIPLGQDFGYQVNEVPAARGKANLQAAQVDVQGQEMTLLQQVASTYWDMVGLLETQKTQRKAVAQSQQLLADNKVRLQAGVISPVDLQVTETQLAREQQQLLGTDLEILRVENQVRTLLNLEALNEYGLKPKDSPRPRTPPGDVDALRERTFDASADLAKLQAALKLNELDLIEARNKDRTDLKLNAYYTLYGYNASQFKTSALNESGLAGRGAVLTWTVPLFDYNTQETLRQRTLEKQQLQLRLESLKSDLSVRMQALVNQLRLSTQEVSTAGRTVKLME
ncbi:MAG: TolC family protein, partial [Deltaproteobacteria bacterium]|nr:TolC family protein [Deltaproteobacteria bacterium]